MRISKIISLLLLFGLVILLWQLATQGKRAWVRASAALALCLAGGIIALLLLNEVKGAFETLGIGPVALGIFALASASAALIAALRKPKKPKTWRQTLGAWIGRGVDRTKRK